MRWTSALCPKSRMATPKVTWSKPFNRFLPKGEFNRWVPKRGGVGRDGYTEGNMVEAILQILNGECNKWVSNGDGVGWMATPKVTLLYAINKSMRLGTAEGNVE